MSRSYKKKNICWLGCKSEKDYKQEYHRRFRHIFDQLLRNGEDENFPHRNKYYDPWIAPSDGKLRMSNDWIQEYLSDESPWNKEWFLKKYRKDSLGRWHMMK
jgi:hypothetical protein